MLRRSQRKRVPPAHFERAAAAKRKVTTTATVTSTPGQPQAEVIYSRAAGTTSCSPSGGNNPMVYSVTTTAPTQSVERSLPSLSGQLQRQADQLVQPRVGHLSPPNNDQLQVPSGIQVISNLGNNINVNESSSNMPNTCARASDELISHVSQSNREKITMGQYIDLASLLQNSNSIEATTPQKITVINGELVLQHKPQQKITNLEAWTDAFIIYMSIYCVAHPEKFQSLLKYMNTVRLAAKRCGTNNFGWKNYDEQFRLKMAADPTNKWGDVDVELWLLYINSSRFNHSLGSMNSNPTYKCYAFNYNGYCPKRNCIYSHSCLKCFGAHPLSGCPRQPSVRFEQNFARSASHLGRPRMEMRQQVNPPAFNFRYPQSFTRARHQGAHMAQGQHTSQN